MELKDIKLKQVLYYMQSFVINAGGTTLEVPRTMILNIDVSKNYDEMIFPMWYVCVNVPLWFYTQMTKNPDNITVTMNLQYTAAETNEALVSNTNPLTTEVSGNFKAVIPSTTQVGDYTTMKNLENADAAYNRNYTYNEYAFIELSLYNKAAYNALYTNLNAVLSSANLTDALTYCFNKCGINNIIMSKSDNNKSYSEFKILPTTAMQNIMRIVDNYNFHNNGSTIFFDLVDSYLVTNKVGCYAWKNNEYKATYILSVSEYDNTLGRQNGIYINTKEKYNVISVQRDGYKSQNVAASPIIKNTGESEVFQFGTSYALLSMLTPNKEFVVSVDSPEHKKYNGKYRLRSVSANMTPSGEFFQANFIVSLIR